MTLELQALLEDTMATATLQSQSLPSEAEAALARDTSRILARGRSARPLRARLLDKSQETIELPPAAVSMLIEILEQMARGNTVTLIPVHAELTTQEAADLLNVSRPYLIGLLDKGKIEYRKIKTHRRIRFENLMAYKQEMDAAREATLAELTAYDQELGL